MLPHSPRDALHILVFARGWGSDGKGLGTPEVKQGIFTSERPIQFIPEKTGVQLGGQQESEFTGRLA